MKCILLVWLTISVFTFNTPCITPSSSLNSHLLKWHIYTDGEIKTLMKQPLRLSLYLDIYFLNNRNICNYYYYCWIICWHKASFCDTYFYTKASSSYKHLFVEHWLPETLHLHCKKPCPPVYCFTASLSDRSLPSAMYFAFLQKLWGSFH